MITHSGSNSKLLTYENIARNNRGLRTDDRIF
jgi:hypothetical protein